MRFLFGKSSIPRNGLLAVAIVWASIASNSVAFDNDGMASNAIVHRAGLKVQWFTHSGAAATSRIVDWHLNINENKATTYHTITAGPYVETFSQNKIGTAGKPLGADGAIEYAEIRRDILLAELANDNRTDVAVELGQYTLPESTIYLLTSTGDVRAIDGDSGETKWSTRIGSSRLPSLGIGSSNNFVAAVNGSNVYCLEPETGKVIWSKKCRYAVAASPAVSDEKIYVPLMNGRLEAFSIAEAGFASQALVAAGEGTARPLITEKTVVWPNSRGTMNVAAKFGKMGLAYQLQADRSIVCSAVFNHGLFFITSLDGFVYAVDEDRGSIVWQVSTGKSISQSPVPIGEFVFVINDDNELYKFDASNGLEAPGWDKPRTGFQRFVGAGKDNLYVLGPYGSLKVVSQNSGTTTSSVSLGDVDMVLGNTQSDRLYISSQRGMIQCISEISSPIPQYHTGEILAATDTTKPKDSDTDPFGDSTDTTEPGKPGTDDVDPFADPSNSTLPTKPKTGDSDPFGGGKTSNPFGGEAKDDKSSSSNSKSGAGSGDADPFGG